MRLPLPFAAGALAALVGCAAGTRPPAGAEGRGVEVHEPLPSAESPVPRGADEVLPAPQELLESPEAQEEDAASMQAAAVRPEPPVPGPTLRPASDREVPPGEGWPEPRSSRPVPTAPPPAPRPPPERITPEPTSPEPSSPSFPEPPPAEDLRTIYELQVAVLYDRESAERGVAEWRRMGLEPSIVPSVDREGRRALSLRLGPWDSRAEADRMQVRLREELGRASVVRWRDVPR